MFELPFGITIDLSLWTWFLELAVWDQAKVLFAMGGWVVLFKFFFEKGAEMWADYRQETKNTSHWKWVLLAVDIPPLFIQTPKAVEQIFAHLSGALLGHVDIAGKYWHGKAQRPFSFEIISIEGYIQFLVRCEVEYRDLLEASIYAQYTEAEITEVEDYVDNIPDKYPNDEYDVMGVEFKLAQPDAYPLRTYPDFEYNISKDAVFSDPMAAILENFSRISHGENLWMQLVVEPVDNSWKEEGIELAKELMSGEAGGHGHGHGGNFLIDVLNKVLAIPKTLVADFAVHGFGFEPGESEHEEEHEKRAEITPGTKKTVEAIEEKIGKLGFKSKLRILYSAHKQVVYNPSRCIDGFAGAMNQFHAMDRNAIVPFGSTHAHYDPKHQKSNGMKTSFVKAFKKRKMKWSSKCKGYVLNIEELATIWHFPLPFVKTPLLHKAGYKRAEPPAGLPTETIESPLKRKDIKVDKPPEEKPPVAPPEELPYA